MASRVVGLDIGHKSLKATILSTTMRGFELVGFGEVPFPDPSRDPTVDEMQTALKEVMEEVGPAPLVITGLPGETISYRTMDFPFRDLRQVDRAIPFSLDEAIPFGLDSQIWDAQRLELSEDGTSTMLAAYTNRINMTRHMDILKEAGLDPRMITTPPLALANLYQHVIPPSEDVQLVVDIGHKITNLVGIKDGSIVAVRSVIWGGRNVTQQLSQSLDISFAGAEELKISGGMLPMSTEPQIDENQRRISRIIEAAIAPLVKEIQFTANLVGAKASSPVRTVQLTGGGSKLGRLDLYLWDKIGLPCQHLELLSEEFNRLPEDFSNPHLLALPLGFATMGMGSSNKQINLRKGEFAYAGEFDYYKKRIIQTMVGMAIILLFAAFNLSTSMWALSHEKSQIRAELGAITKRIVGKAIYNVAQAKAIIDEEVSGKVGDEELPIPEISVTELLAKVSGLFQNAGVEVQITEFTVKTRRNGNSVKVKGTVDSIPSVGKLGESLSSYRCFQDVKAGRTRKDMVGRTEFSFELRVSCAEGTTPEAADAAMEQELAGEPETRENPYGNDGTMLPEADDDGVPLQNLNGPPPVTGTPGRETTTSIPPARLQQPLKIPPPPPPPTQGVNPEPIPTPGMPQKNDSRGPVIPNGGMMQFDPQEPPPPAAKP